MGFLYAAILLAGAAGGVVMFTFGWRDALSGEMVGQCTAGFVIVTPWLSAAGGVVFLVRAIRAVSPWLRHRSSTPPAVRRLALAHDKSIAPMAIAMGVFFGVASLGGFVLLAVFARPREVMGAGLLVQLDALLLLVAVLCLRGAAQALWARRLLAGADAVRPLGTASV